MNASSPTAEPRGPIRRAYATTKTSAQRTTMASQGSDATAVARTIATAEAMTHSTSVMRCSPRPESLTDALVIIATSPPTMARSTGSPYGRPNARRISADAASATAARSAVRAAKPPGSTAARRSRTVAKRRSGLGQQGHRVVLRVSRAAVASLSSAQPIEEDAVTHACRLVAPRRLKGDPLPSGQTARVRRLVPVPVAPARHAARTLRCSARAASFHRSMCRQSWRSGALIAARLDQRPRAVGRHPSTSLYSPLDLAVAS